MNNDDDAMTVMSTTSTGAGTSELIQRTIARDLHIDYSRGVIGQGRYGAVWVLLEMAFFAVSNSK